MRSVLRDDVLGGFPAKTPVRWAPVLRPGRVDYSVESEPGIRLAGIIGAMPGPKRGTVILLTAGALALEERENGVERAEIDRLKRSWDQAGFETLAAQCRELPKFAPIAGVADHTAAESGVWVGRPLLAQWVWDIIRWLDLLDHLHTSSERSNFARPSTPRPYFLVGRGALGLAALLATSLDDRVAGVSCDGGLVSFVAEGAKPWSGVPMSFAIPNILDVGDVAQLGALVAPRPLVFSRPIDTDGRPATRDRTLSAFSFCRESFSSWGGGTAEARGTSGVALFGGPR